MALVLGGAVLLAALNLGTAGRIRRCMCRPTWSSLAGKYLCYAMLALAVDLVWGFAGILPLGHAAFFALGGYAMGMYLMRQIGARGVYGNADLPDFMVFLGWKDVAVVLARLRAGSRFAALMVVLVPGVLALVFGWLAFRSRVTGVYLSIITQALTYALLLAFFRNDMGFGGNNGMTDFKDLLGFPRADRTPPAAALLVLTALFLCGAVPAGALAGDLALRQGADRGARRREPHALPRLPAGVLQAGGLGAVGGHGRHRRRALCAAGRHHQSRRVRAGQFDRGGDLGRGRRPRHAGRVRSSARCWSTSARPVFTGALPELWLFALGALFIFVTLFLPRGIIGLFATRARDRAEPAARQPRSRHRAR